MYGDGRRLSYLYLKPCETRCLEAAITLTNFEEVEDTKTTEVDSRQKNVRVWTVKTEVLVFFIEPGCKVTC